MFVVKCKIYKNWFMIAILCNSAKSEPHKSTQFSQISKIHLLKVFWYLSCFLHFGAEHTLEDHRNPIVQVKDPELMDYIKQAEGGRKARDPVVHRLTLDMLRQLTKDWDWWGHVETWKSWQLDGTYCSSCMLLWLFSCKWFWGTLAAIFSMDMAHKHPWLIALIA